MDWIGIERKEKRQDMKEVGQERTRKERTGKDGKGRDRKEDRKGREPPGAHEISVAREREGGRLGGRNTYGWHGGRCGKERRRGGMLKHH